MLIKTNGDLKQAVNDAIKDSGYKKIWIAEQLGMSNQNLNRFLGKQSFSIDDAYKILNIIGCETTFSLEIIQKDLKK